MLFSFDETPSLTLSWTGADLAAKLGHELEALRLVDRLSEANKRLFL